MSYENYFTLVEELCYELGQEGTYSLTHSTFDSNDFEYQQDLALGVFN